MRKVSILVFVTGVQLFGLYSILVGVIGEKKIIDKEITPIPKKVYNHSYGGKYSTSVNKIIIFTIDALRVDFLFREKMSFVSKILDESNGCIFVARVKAPTVTLPRIKALVSGDISTYWDFIHNFKTSEMTQDNFIWQSKNNFKTLVFYGDDTWLKLFPTQFTRKEGVSSFYVSDFTEVDNNVTRNLRNELSSGKFWDLLVLHYLGLDHIGHVHGPYSNLISYKLEEMDKIIQNIFLHLKQHEKGRSIIVVCGDHGMANVGGHGGNTYPEVTTPLIFLSTESMQKCSNPNWRKEVTTVDQTQVASTLSTFWGIPFPAQSIGMIIPSVLGHLPMKEQLFALHYNAIHLKNVLSKLSYTKDHVDLLKKYDKILETHVQYLEKGYPGDETRLFEEYKILLSDLSSACGAAVGEQNILQLIGGIVIIFQALAMAHLPWVQQYWFRDVICSIMSIFSVAIAFWIRLEWWLPLIVLNFSMIFLKFDWKGIEILETKSTLSWILFTAHYLTPLIYFSSSLVEEEHSVRYYLWSSVLLLFILFYPGGTSALQLGDTCLQIFIGLSSHRIAIAWNQTGQKWSHLNDFVDFLKGNDLCSVVIVLMTLGALYYLRRDKISPTFLASIIFITVLKFDTGWIKFLTFGRVGNLVKLGYIIPVFEGLSTVKAGFDRSTTLMNSWILFTILVQRFYNVPLVFLILVQVKAVSSLCEKLVKLPTRAVIFVWLSYAVFFYQGNSNSIASVDVNAGYLGLEEYDEVLVGLLIFANTFCTPVLVFLSFLDSVGINNEGKYYKSQVVTDVLFETLTRINGVNAAVYSLVILTFRHHLFIWSVFTPKLLQVVTDVLFETLTRINGVNAAVYSLVILTFRHHLFIWSVFTPKLLYVISFTVLNFIIFSFYAITSKQFLAERLFP